MSTPSEQRRTVEAELARALETSPNAGDPATRAAVCAFVDELAGEGQLPETVVVAFKAVLARTESLYRYESDVRDELRWALVSSCIARYFSAREWDDVRVAPRPALRLVREGRAPERDAPDARP